MIQEETTLREVYYRIKEMVESGNKGQQRTGERYEKLLGLLTYPKDEKRDWAIKQLGTLIRFALVPSFIYDVDLIKSGTKCKMSEIRPKKFGNEYHLTLPCAPDSSQRKCSVGSFLKSNHDPIEDIYQGTQQEKTPYIKTLHKLIEQFFDNGVDITLDECKILGDVIISLDCPEGHTVVTGDDDVCIICNVLGQQCVHIPLP